MPRIRAASASVLRPAKAVIEQHSPLADLVRLGTFGENRGRQFRRTPEARRTTMSQTQVWCQYQTESDWRSLGGGGNGVRRALPLAQPQIPPIDWTGPRRRLRLSEDDSNSFSCRLYVN